MQYLNLGRTGLHVSRLCLGCMTYGDPTKGIHPWVLDEAKSRPFYRRAFELGINFFDTAEAYSDGASEEVLGRAIREFSRREEVVIATKVFRRAPPDSPDRGLARKHVRHAIDASLRRLGTDYVDLYQIHRFDYDTPLEETLEALDDVVRAGKALAVGASSMHAWQFAKALYTSQLNGWARFVSMQPQYNLIYREEEREMLPLCRDQGIAVIPWSPLARGFLAGSLAQGARETARARTDPIAKELYHRPEDFAVADRLHEVAAARGVPAMRVALAWVLSKPEITAPIIGASQLSHLEDAASALELSLSTEEVRLLEEPYRPHPVLGHR